MRRACFSLSSDTFAEQAIARATELGLTEPDYVCALFGYCYTATPGRKPYGWFLGAFPYEKRSRS